MSRNLFIEEGREFNHLVKCLPKGKVWSSVHNSKTNIHILAKSIASGLGFLVYRMNEIFNSIFITRCIDEQGLKLWMDDLGFLNDIFYKSTFEQNRKDVFCVKYLMRGQTKKDFKKIANLYGIDVIIESTDLNNIFIRLSFGEADFPIEFPYYFGPDAVVGKVKKIFEKIKPIGTKITYGEPFEETDESIANCVKFNFREK